MKKFTIIWIGQLLSLIGSQATSIALGIWLYRETGSVFSLAFSIFLVETPTLLLFPIAGALVDRMNKKRILILSDGIAALTTIFLLGMSVVGQMSPWHIYLAIAVSSASRALQRPAYMATVALLVPPKQLGRASGMSDMAVASGELLSPILAGILIASMGISSILALDLFTFLVAAGTLIVVPIKEILAERPETDGGLADVVRSLVIDIKGGMAFLQENRSLLHIMVLIAFLNIPLAFFTVLLPVTLLDTFSERIYGIVMGIIGLGTFIGGGFMSAWGGQQNKKILVMSLCWMGWCLGTVFTGIGSHIAWIAATCGFAVNFIIVLHQGHSNPLWVIKTPSHLQGRVQSLRMFIGLGIRPIALLLGGVLVEVVFSPLATTLNHSNIGGVLPESGAGLLLVVSGLAGFFLALAGYQMKSIRYAEALVPDALRQPVTAAAAVGD